MPTHNFTSYDIVNYTIIFISDYTTITYAIEKSLDQ